jgi:adenine-specific DNA-methyltransferase
MSRVILEDIIADFSPDKFVRFFRDKSNKFAPRQENFAQYNDGNFKDGKKLGEIIFVEAEHLAIFTFQVSQPISERSGKKAQYEKGKKILKERQYDAGIFIFYDNKRNFRFSLIYANYLGKRRDWSVFRRFTYFISKDLTNKTFYQRIGDGDFSSLEKIKDAFSVEKITKEFYQDIANWYFWAIQRSTFPKDAEEEENGRNIAVIRLITRMIFIWFMREQGLVPKTFFEEKNISATLKEISPESSTYYQAILQNLFFATLSTQKDERKFRSEIRGYKGYNPDFGNQNVFRFQELFKDPNRIKDYFGEIPFLNGGLFECLDDKPNGIYIDGFTSIKKNQPNVQNFLFFSGEKKADLNVAYGTKSKTYKVKGLLDILSSFNFTIDENSPDDQDIALDPELLGRVFENLLASFNPETSTTARKATGSYYTPREIVDYMVVESLKDYFKTHLSAISDLDKKIDRLFSTGSEENPFNKAESKKLVELIEGVRIVDPAVGSGAFPMGALNKLVFILNKVDPGNELWKQAQLSAADTIPDPRIKQDTKNRIEEFFKGKNADYGRKLYLIQKCIYGVDIQQIAVEIAKLRFFISLLVDEKIDRNHPDGNWGIEPLPNLDFKIMQGNSLISEFLGIDFDNGQDKQETQIQVGFGFENEDDSLIKEFERKKIDYQNESDKDKKTKLKNEVEDLMIKIFESKVKKQKANYFKDIEKIEQKYSILPNKQSREEIIVKEKQSLSRKTGFDLENIEKQLREFTSKKKTRPFFPWKLYFAEVFENGGFDIVIANPPYITYKGKEVVNISDADVKQLISLYPNSAEYKVNSYALFTERGINLLKKNGTLIYIIPSTILQNEYLKKIRKYLITKYHISQIVSFANKVFGAVTDSILLKVNNSHSGELKTIAVRKNDLDFSNLNDLRTYNPEIWNNEVSDFVINLKTNESEDIILNKIEFNSELIDDYLEVYVGIVANGIKKFLSDSKINSSYKKYLQGKHINNFAIYPDKLFINFIIEKLHSNTDETVYLQKEKILVRKTGNKLIAVIDNEKYYTDQSIYNLYPKKGKTVNLKVITALLNSPLMEYYFNKKMVTNPDVFPYIKGIHLKKLPIKFPKSQSEEKQLETLVEKIIEGKKENKDTSDYEKQIDQLVYKLYGLTPEEIKIVEGGGRNG